MIDKTLTYPLGDDPPTARLIYGAHVLEGLKRVPDGSVHMVATSPPYWGLRDYGTATWEGGVLDCDHQVGGQVPDSKNPNAIRSGVRPGADVSRCKRCGATRVDDQIGLEPTPEQYIESMVEVFREIRRVLRDDGVAWLNLGDSYVTPMKGIGGDDGFSAGGSKRQHNRTQPKMDDPIRANYGNLAIKPKDLVGIPWRVAFALQADGWTLRQDVVWAKNNPMPESVIDRCTRAHEYLFMFVKAERYFYDHEAIKEPSVSESPQGTGGYVRSERLTYRDAGGSPRGGGKGWSDLGGMRNKRSVWIVNTKPYPGAHFATWPEDLVEPMIKAGSSEKGCCSQCGAPQSRMTSKKRTGWDGSKYGERAVAATGGAVRGGTQKSTLGSSGGVLVNRTVTEGWRPTCECNAEIVPCTVLDPFSGSATTGAVAMRLGRNYIGTDLNESYYPLAEARLLGHKAPQGVEDDGGESILDLFGQE